tara:strand:- start:37 stop:189 length:153 start_codon:yes stop_codon:yes gene_type:complete
MLVCDYCKSANVMVQGWYNPNERYEATEYDAAYCEECDSVCDVIDTDEEE